MESESVEEALEDVHHHQDSEGYCYEGEPDDEGLQHDGAQASSGGSFDSPCGSEALREENFT